MIINVSCYSGKIKRLKKVTVFTEKSIPILKYRRSDHSSIPSITVKDKDSRISLP